MRSFPISPKPTSQDETSELDLLQILNTLWRGKPLILFWMFLTGALSVYYVFFIATPIYTTTSTIALQNRDEKIVDLVSPLSGLGADNYTINTEAEALASRELIGQVVDKLNLISDPVFNSELRPMDQAWSPGKAIGAFWALIGNTLDSSDRVDFEAVPTPDQIRDRVIDAAQEAISITNLSSSYVFYITVRTNSPLASARLANGVAEGYIADQITIKYKATEQATLWLNGRVADLKLELEAAENAVKDYSAGIALIGPDALATLNRQLKDRRDRIIDAQSSADAAEAFVQALDAARASGDRVQMATVAGDAALGQIVSQLSTEGASEAFDARFQRILIRARFEARQASSKILALKKSADELTSQVERQSVELLKLQQLEREAAASRQIYEYFLGRLKEISVQQGIHRADSRILSRALVPSEPSQPRKSLILVVAVFIGFVVGAALVMVRELRQRGFRSAEDLEQALGLPVLSQVPRAPVTKRRRLRDYLVRRPTSAFSESIRNLRTSIKLSKVDQSPQVIMVTSSLPGEGKTTQSLALAQSFVGIDKRVLLIEGDIRRRTLQEYFRGRRRQPGLASVVMENMPLQDAVLFVEELGFDVLLGEKSTVNAADFFSSNRFERFMTEARAEYDLILIDTPPVLVVPDARVIGQVSDSIVYVVHWNRTTRSQVEAGINALASVDLNISGFSLSQVDVHKAKSYGGQYSEVYAGYGTNYYRN